MKNIKYRTKVKLARLIPIKRTSQDWQHLFPEIKILDPDGWDRHPDRFDEDWYHTKITYKEYEKRMLSSTCRFHINLFTCQSAPSLFSSFSSPTTLNTITL